MNYHWTSKKVSKTDWREYYSNISTYTFLEDKGDGILIGFISTPDIPRGCEEITDIEHLRIIDIHRKQANIGPSPLKKVTT